MEKEEIVNEVLPKGAVMSKEVAEKELESWFDYRKTKESARHNYNEDVGKDVMREALIDGFMYGNLIFDKTTGHLVQKLDFPIESEKKSMCVDELSWKPRFRESDTTEPMRGVKANDTTGRMKAYISAITDTSKIHIGALDYSDYSLSQTIVSYFLT